MTECFINVSSSEDSEVNQVNDMSMDISITSRSSELNLTSVSTKKSKLKTRRLSYTIQFRLEAIEWHKNNGNNQSETARQYGTSRQNIALWLQNEDKYCNLLDNKSVSVKTRRRLLKPRIGKFPEMESKLIEWFTKTRNDKLFVTYELLISKALEIFNEINTNKRETVGLEKSDSLLFKASTGWVQGFMQRYQLSVRAVTTIGQKIPKNAREISFCFFQNVDNFRSQQLLQNNQIIIINMDEIPVYFDLPQNHTIDKIGNKSVALRTTGHEKTRFTLILCGDNMGRKYKATIIFKNLKKIPKCKFPSDVEVMVSAKGSMTTDLMHQWITKVFAKRPDGLFLNMAVKNCQLKYRSLLTIDAARAHRSIEIKKLFASHYATKVEIIPGGMTPLLQPADVSWNRPVKSHLKKYWADWMASADDTKPKTKDGNVKRPSYGLIAEWCSKAWKAIPLQQIIDSFKQCNLSQVRDDTQLHSKLKCILSDRQQSDGQQESTGISDTESDNEEIDEVIDYIPDVN